MNEMVLIIVLSGLPAAGKSTLARALSLELQRQGGDAFKADHRL